jgi:hypothetical protein
MLAQIGDGEAEASLSLELFNLLAELREQAVSTQSERKGELTLKIKIVVDKGAKTMTADYDVGTKEPKPPRQGSMFFFTSGGNWALDNPRQQKLGLRALDAELVKLKEPAAQ